MVLLGIALALLSFLSIVLDAFCVYHVVFYNKNIRIVSLYVFELLQSNQNKLQKQTTTTSTAMVNTTFNTTTVGITLQYS